MRIERVQASPHKKGRVLVFLEDGACLKITEQEALDFGLRTGDDLDGRRLEQLKKAASVSNVKATAADLIGKRAMSRRDLERKLQEKGASQAEARYAAEWLEAIGAINDADYAAILVRHCAGLGYGPDRIREKLREKGVPRELRLWIRHRTAPGRLTDFLRPSSGAGPQRRRRSGGSPAHCCGGGLLGETSGRHGAVWERRFSKNESRLAGGIPSGEAYGPPNGGYGVPAPTSGRICPATSWLSFPVQWDTHAGPAGPILQQSIDWRTRSCHTTFPLSPWAAPRIR